MRQFVLIIALTGLMVFGALREVALGQRQPEIQISVGEDFFNTVVDAVLSGPDFPEFSIASLSGVKHSGENGDKPLWPEFIQALYQSGPEFRRQSGACREVITLRREGSGGRTAIRLSGGKISAPLSFTGQYNPPFIGCVQFAGIADTELDLEYDQTTRRLLARARVVNVNLEGSGGVGGGIIARMVQSSIDKKINPIEIISLDKLSFLVPVQTDSRLQLTASNLRTAILPGRIDIFVSYDVSRAK